MSLLIETFVPSSTYNHLPLITEVASAPDIYKKDLEELRELMQKHNVPKGVSVRLIHKHFDTTAGEVMIFEKVAIPEPSFVQVMKPMVPSTSSKLRERGLQNIFGLKLQLDSDAEHTGWTEYEFHAQRGTIMFPDGMPMPGGQSDLSVTTEWKAILKQLPRNCKHSTTCAHGATRCKHCRHCTRHDGVESDELGYCLGGQNILPGSPVYDIVHQVIHAF
ncbi:unnamed protein product [Clonostachys rosea]|uniref:Uncharacterized protein n=1 Tax=Bionectria ochroleuca TaxID=29856 RepID=A0ABY6U6V6_BIOOC|nr:unnamed protein product [Clonostachys rosea]